MTPEPTSKALQLAENSIHTANAIADQLKKLPKSGKRNPFVKTYNRRPQNKKKRAMVMASVAVLKMTGAIQCAIIISQPTPKFERGSVTVAKPDYVQ